VCRLTTLRANLDPLADFRPSAESQGDHCQTLLLCAEGKVNAKAFKAA
jgi:hypothetical protein